MVSRLIIVGWLGVLVVSATAYAAQSTALSAEERKWLDRYRAKLDDLKWFYTHCRMKVVARKSYGREDAVEMTEEVAYVYLSNGTEHLRLDSTVNAHRATGRKYPDSRLNERRVFACSAAGYFEAVATGADAPMRLDMLDGDTTQGRVKFTEGFGFPHAPFAAFGLPLEEAVFGIPSGTKDYSIDSVRLADTPQPVIIITATYTASNERTALFEFHLLRDKAFALAEFKMGDADMTLDGAQQERGLMDYEGEVDGIPLMKRVTQWTEGGDPKGRYHVQEYDVVALEKADVPLSEFLPSAVGINAKFPSDRSPWRWSISAILGIALIGIYLIIRKLGSGKATAC